MENEQAPKTTLQEDCVERMIFLRKLQKANKNGTNLKMIIPTRIVRHLELKKQQIVRIWLDDEKGTKIIKVEPTSEIIPRKEKTKNPITETETKTPIIQ